MRLYYWIHHTGAYDGGTGVQRVVRNLATGLGADHELVPVRWSDEREALVLAEQAWVDGLAQYAGPQLCVPLDAGLDLHLSLQERDHLDGAWLVVPEVPHVAGDDAPSLAVALDYARFHGLRTAAVFYDLIPLRRAGYEAMRHDHSRYALALAAADVVLAISDDCARDLRHWWAEQGLQPDGLPPVVPVPLPEQILGRDRVTAVGREPDGPVRFVTVGSVEPRKNQLGTIRALLALTARRPDLDVRLDVVGGLHGAVQAEVMALVADTDLVELHGWLPDERVHDLVGAADASIFVSHDEGYGLPIAESLWLGTPCLASDHGSMAEIAAGGGCLLVQADDSDAIERALERLADDAGLRRDLALAAARRDLRTWADYGRAVVAALTSSPDIARLVLLDGTRADPDAAQAYVDAGVQLERLHWKPSSRALLPGALDVPMPPVVGAGRLGGRWALLPGAGTAGPEEARAILGVAHGLGLRVALEAVDGWPPEVLAAADLTLFDDDAARDLALSAARREVTRLVGVADRFRVGKGADALAVIATMRCRTSAIAVPRTPERIYYWVGLTVTQPFNTGVQRVTRLLAASLERLGVEVVPVGWDEAQERMVHVSTEQAEHLARWSGPPARAWQPLPADLSGAWLVVPEITVPVGAEPVTHLARRYGMRVAAVFYDLIPAKMPENYPDAALRELTRYWTLFGHVDLALPISWTMAADLHRWLADQGLRTPPTVPVPLAGEPPAVARVAHGRELGPNEPLELLAVGTWEPRKNYPRLLRAFTSAQQRTVRPLRLTIVGRRAGFDDLDAEITKLARESGTTLLGHVEDGELEQLHAASAATVFASWEEGFGLPVLESIWQGRPCLAHDGSALAEVAPGGGVLSVDILDEQAVSDALVRLAEEEGLLERLSAEALARSVRSWDEYGQDVLGALARAAAPPGWSLPTLVRRRPLLTCAITTYNRASWLGHSLDRLLEATRPWRDVVEVVVCDNASTDDTPSVVSRFRGEPGLSLHRNAANVGMLGNLGATARVSQGAFVWELGDDDLLVEGAVENVLEGLVAHPDIEMAYLNYAYTHFDDPGRLADVSEVMATATPIAPGGPNRWVAELREVAGLNENLFTAIYACVFRRDHALRAYQLDTRGAPFSSLATCVPSSVYALAALQDRPAWWVGEPALVVNMNVSWLRWALLWHLERMPDLFEQAEARGVDPARLDVYRLQHLSAVEQWVRAAYFEAEEPIRHGFSMRRLLERSKHLPEFRERHLPGVRRAYADAYQAGRVAVDAVPPGELFAAYGLQG